MNTKKCRACNADNIASAFNLISRLYTYPGRQIYDLFFEVTGIDAKMDHKDMPQQLCNICATKLKIAYDFVMQARQANNYFLAQIEEIETKAESIMDCLHEMPMIIPEQEETEYESEEETKENIVIVEDETNEIIVPSNIVEDETKENMEKSENVEDEVEETLNDLLEECKDQQETKQYENKTTEDKPYECFHCSKVFQNSRYLTLHMGRHSNKDDWLTCPHCSRRFYRQDTLRLHVLKIHGQIKEPCVYPGKTKKRQNMKVESVDLNLCKPNGCKLILCMICHQKFVKINELRYHLNNHSAVENEQYMSLADNLFYENYKMTKDEFIKTIRNDIESGKHLLFGSITNQAGYELSLDSSDTDNESVDMPITENKQDVKYKCELCDANYQRKYQLFNHQQQVHKWLDAPHVCSRCDGHFVSKQLLDHHEKSQCKNPLKRFFCQKCPMRFNWKNNLKTHLKEHNDHANQPENFECAECKRSFVDQKGLKVHMKTVHNEESNFFLCLWCERKFYRRDCLVKHMLRHGITETDVPQAENLMAAICSPNGQKSVICKICDVKFKSIKYLHKHIKVKHNGDNAALNYSITNAAGYEMDIEDSDTDDDEDEDDDECAAPLKYTCDLCSMKQRRKYQSVQHQRVHHPYQNYPNQCEKCVFKSTCKVVLDYHKRTQCFNNEKPYQCQICNYKCMWKDNLILHQKQHDAALNTENGDDEDTTMKPAGSKYVCPHCGKSYYIKGCLKNHIRDVHIEDNRKFKESLKKYLCSLCGFQTSVKSKLTIHTRIHTGEKPYECDMCDKSFARRYQLDTHLRNHTGERPFTCTECGKRYARRDRLYVHLRAHRRRVEKENKKNAKNKNSKS